MARLNSLGVQKVLAKYVAYSGSIQSDFIFLLRAMTASSGEGSSAGAGFRILPPGGTAHALSSMTRSMASARISSKR